MTSAPPLVSVVVPCYRQAEFLDDCVTSVVSQTFTAWEMVIVAGCDQSAAAARALVAKFASRRIVVLEAPPRGVSDARNVGIGASRGSLILPLDADDVLAPTFLDRTVSVLDQDARHAIVTTNLQEFGDRHGAWDLPPYSRFHLLYSNGLCIASLFTRTLYDVTGGYDVALPLGYEDWNFWIACSKHEPMVRHVPERLLNYRVHATSNTGQTAAFDAHMRAMIRVLHPNEYPSPCLVDAHAALMAMPEDVLARLDRAVGHFPANPNLRFFRGLGREGRADPGCSDDYREAVARSRGTHWQAALRLEALSPADRGLCQTVLGRHAPVWVCVFRPDLAPVPT